MLCKENISMSIADWTFEQSTICIESKCPTKTTIAMKLPLVTVLYMQLYWYYPTKTAIVMKLPHATLIKLDYNKITPCYPNKTGIR